MYGVRAGRTALFQGLRRHYAIDLPRPLRRLQGRETAAYPLSAGIAGSMNAITVRIQLKSKPYTVQPGDTLTRIAAREQYSSWRDIYYHPDNAAFRVKAPQSQPDLPGRRADAAQQGGRR